MGDPRIGHQRAPLAARGRVAQITPQPGILPAEQPDSKSHQETPVGAAKCAPPSGSASAMANRQEPLFVSMGTVAITHRGEGGHSTFALDRASLGGAYAGSVLMAFMRNRGN